MITDKRVLGALRGVMHPEIKRNLVELEMIRDVSVEDERVTLTLALPFQTSEVSENLGGL
jgi:ATP-binding protein involved in chromosome partitioning